MHPRARLSRKDSHLIPIEEPHVHPEPPPSRVNPISALKAFWVATEPEPAPLRDALERRWEELPDHVKTPSQALGKRTVGCEGTHGVFPRCNLACTPCYHAKEAQRIRTDGEHTRTEIDRQMAYLAKQRGPGQNAQLIGGEVTLLSPDDHADALLVMQHHGRKPMSMSHGDFDYEYLEALAVSDGEVRLPFLSFAGHFDSMMFGRRGIKKVDREAELNPHRRAFCAMFQRLEREHGVRHYLAHNMTVTPRNLGQVAEVIRDNVDAGFRMFSFQPAAFVGNQKRWKDDYREVTGDAVWAEIERGAGAPLPYKTLQIGDERCNRTAYGAYVGERWICLLDPDDPRDHAWRDRFFATFGGMDFAVPPAVLVGKLARVFARDPGALPDAARWFARFVRRCGGVRAVLRDRPRAVTFVMHSFMDAKVVRPAWEAMQRGEVATDPDVRAAQERLSACSYAMAHPDDDRLVPACVQHSVLDPEENLKLMELLPMHAPAIEVTI